MADLDVATLRRWYGAWDPVRPEEVAERLAGFTGPWWIAGGWALEAFTGVRRPHDDVDVSIFRRDAEALRTAVADRYTCWAAHQGGLTPYSEFEPEVHPDANQLWLRPDAASHWQLEVLLNPDRDGRWVNRRQPEHTAELDEITWVREDGVRFLHPEVALLFKAKWVRAKDEHDFDAALPLLGGAQRAWLGDMLERLHPGHPWRSRLTR